MEHPHPPPTKSAEVDLDALKQKILHEIDPEAGWLNLDKILKYLAASGHLATGRDGMVLVPVEPTTEMIKLGEPLEHFESGYGSACDEFYRAMIAPYLPKEKE